VIIRVVPNKVEMKEKTVLVKMNFPFTIGFVPQLGKMVQLSGKLFHHHRIREMSCNLGINSSNMLEYYEYKCIGINTCEKLLIYKKEMFSFPWGHEIPHTTS